MLNCEFEGGKGGETVLRSSLVTTADDGNVHLAYLTSEPGVLLELELRSSDDTLLVGIKYFVVVVGDSCGSQSDVPSGRAGN